MKAATRVTSNAIMAALITAQVSSKIDDLGNQGQDVIMRITGFPKSAEENKNAN